MTEQLTIGVGKSRQEKSILGSGNALGNKRLQNLDRSPPMFRSLLRLKHVG